MSLIILKRLLYSKDIEIQLVITQPEKQKSRIFKNYLLEWINRYHPGLPCEQVNSSADITSAIAERKIGSVDYIVCCWFLYKIPKSIVSMASVAALNIHPSLLPAYRGADPIRRAILNKEEETGVTIHRLTDVLDSGEIIAQSAMEIPGNAYFDDVCERLGFVAAELVSNVINNYEEYSAHRMEQNAEKATYAASLRDEELLVRSGSRAIDVYNLVRACYPWKIVQAEIGNCTMKIGPIMAYDFQKGSASKAEVVVREKTLYFADATGYVEVCFSK